MKYYIVRWVDIDGKDTRLRAAYREGCEALLPTPTMAGAWSTPVLFNFAKANPSIQAALAAGGIYHEKLVSPLGQDEPEVIPTRH